MVCNKAAGDGNTKTKKLRQLVSRQPVLSLCLLELLRITGLVLGILTSVMLIKRFYATFQNSHLFIEIEQAISSFK